MVLPLLRFYSSLFISFAVIFISHPCIDDRYKIKKREIFILLRKNMYDNRHHGCRRYSVGEWVRERIMYSLLLKLTSIAFILLSLSYRCCFSVLLLENNAYHIILYRDYIESCEWWKETSKSIEHKRKFSPLISEWVRELSWNERKIVFILLLLLKSFSLTPVFAFFSLLF